MCVFAICQSLANIIASFFDRVNKNAKKAVKGKKNTKFFIDTAFSL